MEDESMFENELGELQDSVSLLSKSLTKIRQGATELSSSGRGESREETLESLMSYTKLDTFKAKLHREDVDKYFSFGKIQEAPLVLKFLISLTSVLDDDKTLDWMEAALLDFAIDDPAVEIMAPKVLNRIIAALKQRGPSKRKSKEHTIIHIARSLLVRNN